MASLTIKQIGVIRAGEDGFLIALDPPYRKAMTGLEGFSHLNIFWWFNRCDDDAARGKLLETRPYTHGPQVLGTFATRSPERPNPIALSCAGVTFIDAENGLIGLAYLDAEDGSPVLDIKPYVPSLDRVEEPQVPAWCAHWPKQVESSGDFDWASEFLF